MDKVFYLVLCTGLVPACKFQHESDGYRYDTEKEAREAAEEMAFRFPGKYFYVSKAFCKYVSLKPIQVVELWEKPNGNNI